MSNYDPDQLQDDILSIDKDSYSETDFYEDEANINVSGYSSCDEIDDDIPGKFNKK
jgi:hypothetical protein